MGAFDIADTELSCQMAMLRRLVAQPMVAAAATYLEPAMIAEDLLVGSKEHAADVHKLVRLGVTAVLNCAPSGISTLPLDTYKENSIRYKFTNVRRDDNDYPILHDNDGIFSKHLETAQAFYDKVQEEGGKALFFCVAGQNRSATLATAVLLIQDNTLQTVLERFATSRPFVLENVGFQRQLVELEALVKKSRKNDPPQDGFGARRRWNLLLFEHHGAVSRSSSKAVSISGSSPSPKSEGIVVELRVPGFCTCFDVAIPAEATIANVKQVLEDKVGSYLSTEASVVVGKSWLVFSMFGSLTDVDLLLEEEAVESSLQVARLQNTFGLEVLPSLVSDGDPILCWTEECRFELVIFSLIKSTSDPSEAPVHEPFVFRHQERPCVPGTLLSNNFVDTHVRAWDFGTGDAFRSKYPIVFSFSADPRSRRDFIDISTSALDQCQKFRDPDPGRVLGMGVNAVVHRVELAASLIPSKPKSRKPVRTTSEVSVEQGPEWDAAVKRPFSVAKMMAALGNKSEAGLAKRLRMAGALNRQGRLLYFYGLGITLASNYDDREEYKFEATLLSRYQEEFSTYTLKNFLDDYVCIPPTSDSQKMRSSQLHKLQDNFSIIQVKVLLVSLMNGFRDLTLMGVQAFDFNHLNNVLISRDYRKARLIDIDGANKGSIQFPSDYIQGRLHGAESTQNGELQLHKPALDVDLATLLPDVLEQLILGKGRGKSFVGDVTSRARRASAKSEDEAKAILRNVIWENFFCKHSVGRPEVDATNSHLSKVVEWFYAVLLKRWPWTKWTSDIYDAMRCIDHLPIG
eukprot:TRINITY_DN43612_c0_g1_i1.p1 TRINITY_DN43612_c0_g1~~TRINITY_DN43612_c0_g1_i1.p1  ORF type:complete len:800 (+),score=110.19 TRINITY_DN43612_c0_g1_i1:115-2514(+)